jgi:putative CocE/NonD family hydrolase
MKYQSNVPGEKNTNRTTWYVMGAYNVPGAPGNYWTTADDFPTFVPTEFFLSDSRVLTVGENAPVQSGAASIVYDPGNPVPTVGGNNLEIECGPLDQQPVEESARPNDVLTFTTAPLETDLYTCGPIVVRLFVQSNCTDTDFTAKLTHVYPDGTSRLLADGIIRMRWRMGIYYSAEPQPITPGEVYEVNVDLWNTSYAFPAGHQVRVSISSSNFPRFETNPNNGLPLNETGTEYVALNSIMYGPATPSALILPVVDKAQMPPIGVLELADQRREMIERRTGEKLDMAAVYRASQILDKDLQEWARSIGQL